MKTMTRLGNCCTIVSSALVCFSCGGSRTLPSLQDYLTMVAFFLMPQDQTRHLLTHLPAGSFSDYLWRVRWSWTFHSFWVLDYSDHQRPAFSSVKCIMICCQVNTKLYFCFPLQVHTAVMSSKYKSPKLYNGWIASQSTWVHLRQNLYSPQLVFVCWNAHIHVTHIFKPSCKPSRWGFLLKCHNILLEYYFEIIFPAIIVHLLNLNLVSF